MNLLILDGPSHPRPGRNPSYRGTDRAHPTYCDAAPESEEINQLFLWFLEEGGESGIVHDRPRAIHYAKLLNEQFRNQFFEVVEVFEGDASPVSPGQLLGFDLSLHFNSSLLQWGLMTFEQSNGLPNAIAELCKLLSLHYTPQLNENGLFQTHEIASLCLKAMIALQSFSPNLYEGGDLSRFAVVGLYQLSNSVSLKTAMQK
jgi:hypothetical protein